MEESRVSFPIGTETKVEGTGWSSIKGTAACEDPVWNTPTSEHPRLSDRTESDNDCTAEKFCRLEVEAALAAALSSETCETPRSSECNTGATAGDITAPSGSDVDAEAYAFTDSELLVGTSGERCCRLEAEEANSVAFSSETSECQTGATAGDSTFPSCSDTEADGDHALPLDVTGKKCCRLEVEQALSLAVFSETCESLSRSAESHTDAAAAGDSTIPSLSDAGEVPHLEGVPPFQKTDEGPGQHEEPGEGWATELSTMSSEIEEGMWKEVSFGKRRPLATMQRNKPSSKGLLRVALDALSDAVDLFVNESGSVPPCGVLMSGPRGQGRSSGNFATSRRSAPGSRASVPQESHSQEEAPTEAEVWASKHVQATLEAIASRPETVERIIKSFQMQTPDVSQEALEVPRQLLQHMVKELAGAMSLSTGEQTTRRPFQQAKVELLMRRLLRLRDVLPADGGGGFTEVDVQLALMGVRRHLRTAQRVAAKLSPVPASATVTAAAAAEG